MHRLAKVVCPLPIKLLGLFYNCSLHMRGQVMMVVGEKEGEEHILDS